MNPRFVISIVALALLCRTVAAQEDTELARRREVESQLRKQLFTMKPGEREERRDLFNELLGLEGDVSRSLKSRLRSARKKALKQLEKEAASKSLAPIIREMEGELNVARKSALALIFDESRYPYPHDRGTPAGRLHDRTQKEINDLVGEVRKRWEPFPALLDRRPRLKTLVADVQEIEGYQEAAGEPPESAFNPEKFADAIREQWRSLLIDEGSRETLEYNKTQEQFLYPGEAECIRWTNDYRLMMGRTAVETDVRLVASCRLHSREMRDLDYFAHESPVPANRSPGQRAVQQQYRGYRGENIAMGRPTGKGAFMGWYNSSGHHRNILKKGHKHIGVGYAAKPGAGFGGGHLWTQQFGRGGSLRGKNPPIARYLRKWLPSPADNADKQYELALLAGKLGLPWQFDYQVAQVLRLNPSHAGALKLKNNRAGGLGKKR